MSLSAATVRQRGIDFVDLIGNKHDTTSDHVVGLLDDSFAVQHGEQPPSTGGRDSFLALIGERLKLAGGQVSVEIKRTVAAVDDDGKGGQCWVYSRKNTPLGSRDSLDMMMFNADGKIVLCQDLHSPVIEQ